MASRMRGALRRTRLVLGVWGLGIALVAAGVAIAYRFVGPAPPDKIVLATGVEGGAYRAFGEQLAVLLASQGVEVELRQTAGAVENLQLLDSDTDVDIAFVQSGLGHIAPDSQITTLGSLYFEPLWLFVANDLQVDNASDLGGKRVAVGAKGSGTRLVVMRLLEASGVESPATTMLDTSVEDLASAFSEGDIDAAFLIGGVESRLVADLIASDDVRLVSLRRAGALARHASYLTRLELPEGLLDLKNNKPEADVETVAVTAMLAAREDLHPAIIDLVMISSDDIFGGHTLLSNTGDFPSPQNVDLPLSKESERYYERGAPFLMRYLPFWAATLVDRLWVLLLPMIGLMIPLFKLMPPLYHWRIRRKLLQRYGVLRELDPQDSPVKSIDDRNARLARIAELDAETFDVVVPRDYSDDVYKLRRDIDLVRRKLQETATDLPSE